MLSTTDAPKVFISYSWKPEANRQKTLSLAKRLENEGVHVIIDEWNLSEGQDKYKFMEQMVNDPDVKRVLLICNKEYSEKANKKIGGVGIESLIVSDEIYSKAEQTKFIPIIFEKDESGKEFVPTFIKSRKYIDLSVEISFEEEYEKLMRNLFDKPSSKRPPRGNPPAYILEEDSKFLRTTHKVKTIKDFLLQDKRNSQILINEYYEMFIESLKDFEIIQTDLIDSIKIDDLIVSRIEELKSLRDDFIDFLEVVFSYSLTFDQDRFLQFFENLIIFINNPNSFKYPERTFGYYMKDHYKFFFYELFLYTATIMTTKERFSELGGLLHQNFVIYNEKRGNTEIHSYTIFNQPVESLNDIRNKRLDMRRKNLVADLIKQRADLPKYPFTQINEIDVLLSYISLIRPKVMDQWSWEGWFPHTSVYHVECVTIIEKLLSKRFFEKVKYIFDVKNVEDLKSKIEQLGENNNRPLGFNYYFPSIKNAFNFDKIAKY